MNLFQEKISLFLPVFMNMICCVPEAMFLNESYMKEKITTLIFWVELL